MCGQGMWTGSVDRDLYVSPPQLSNCQDPIQLAASIRIECLAALLASVRGGGIYQVWLIYFTMHAKTISLRYDRLIDDDHTVVQYRTCINVL